MMTKYYKTLDILGDTLRIQWTGSVWVSPSNGQQHAHAADAMRVEIEYYLSASGEDLDDESVQDQIDGFLSQMEDEE